MKKLTTILVPVDFSAVAKNALEYAILFARKIHARLVLLHVYYIPGVSARVQYVAGEESFAGEYKEAEQRLMNLEKEVPLLRTVPYQAKALSAYWPIEFPEIIAQQKADLIIMGTKGASGLKEITIGTTTASVIEGTAVPALVIPLSARFGTVKNIGLAVDGQNIDDLSMLDPLLSIARYLNARIEIFHIRKNAGEQALTAEPSQNITAIQAYLGNTPALHDEAGSGSIWHSISRYAAKKSIGLVVMIARKRNALQNLFRSSITQKMVFHSTTALLVIPEKSIESR
jgi:nucleotide-binding universal stress UspA family protein